MKLEIPCKNCNKLVLRIPSNSKGNIFCSKTCSNSFNNRISKKRKLKKVHCKCGVEIVRTSKFDRITVCETCNPSFSKRTIGEVKEMRKTQYSSAIRNHARTVFYRETPDPKCLICNYALHIEVCHKQAINSFPDDSSISTVNSLSNLVGLCRNHHWEFDNGYLAL